MKRTFIRSVLRWSLLFAGASFVIVLLFAHPWFAVTRPSGGRVLVAEGWMHRQGLEEAARLFQHGDYEHLYLTGTLRPFAYYLLRNDSMTVIFDRPVAGPIELGIGGLPGARFQLAVDGAVLIQDSTPANAEVFKASIVAPGARTFALTVHAASDPGTEVPVAFVARLWVEGHNAHDDLPRIEIHHADGRVTRGQPTFADQAYAILRKDGVPADRMTVVPTIEVDRSKTFSSARSFVHYALEHDISRFDVATLGVHARRTWKLYRRALGPRGVVGVISLPDRWCGRWSWWTNYYGWFQMLKELIALPAPYLIDVDAAPDDRQALSFEHGSPGPSPH